MLNEQESYMNSPLFHEAMEHFRRGKWDEGFSKFGEVQKEYPTQSDLRSIRLEMEVRSSITEYEQVENKSNRMRKLSVYGIRTITVVCLLALVFLAITTYYGWISNQLEKAQVEFSRNIMQAELTMEFRNAQQLMMAGKSDEALQRYENIKAKNPEFPGLTEAIAQAEKLKDVEIQYTQAMNLLQTGDSAQALAILTEISQEMPNYRDVSLQIKNLQSAAKMNSVFQQADQAFPEGRYEDAVNSYELLRIMDPTYQVTHLENNLFHSYINAAKELLAEPSHPWRH